MGLQVCKHLAKPLEAGTQRRIVIGISDYKWSIHNNRQMHTYGYGNSCI